MANKTGKPPSSLDIYLENRKELLAVARAIVVDSAVAEDLVQESWLRWHARVYAIEAARPILRRIVTNLARDFLRRRRTEGAVMAALVLTPDTDPDVERIVASRRDVERVGEALAELPERTQLAFKLSCIDGLTYAEIAQRLCVSKPRAHQMVRQALVKITLRLGAPN